MALVVNHNIPALQAYNAVNFTTSALEKSIQKLSTGLRINSAADDAAGLAISEKMRAQVRGLDRAVMNSQDGISMIQTAEGALNETHSILQRMRELSVQAANDTLTQQDRGYIQEEINQLREEITRIGNTTQFNKKKLLDGSAAALWSSSDLSTKAIVNGGLRTIDQFGQKSAAEGNYIININADPGKAQAQKSDIFTIKHKDVIMNVGTNEPAGVDSVYVNNIPAGDYQVTLGSIEATEGYVDGMTKGAGAEVLNGIVRSVAHTISASEIATGAGSASGFRITVGTVSRDASGRTTGVSLTIQAYTAGGDITATEGSSVIENYTGDALAVTVAGITINLDMEAADFEKLAKDMSIDYKVVPEAAGKISGQAVNMISSFAATASGSDSYALTAAGVSYTIKDANGDYVSASFTLEILTADGDVMEIGVNTIAARYNNVNYAVGSASGPLYHMILTANAANGGSASSWVDIDNDGRMDFEILIAGVKATGTTGTVNVSQTTKSVDNVGTYVSGSALANSAENDKIRNNLQHVVVGVSIIAAGQSTTQLFPEGTFEITDIITANGNTMYDVHVTFKANDGSTSGTFTLNINSSGALAGAPVSGSSISFGHYKFQLDFSKALVEMGSAGDASGLVGLKGAKFGIQKSSAQIGDVSEVSNSAVNTRVPKATFVPNDVDTFISTDVVLHVTSVTGAAGSEQLTYSIMDKSGNVLVTSGQAAIGAVTQPINLGTAIGTITLDFTAAKASDFKPGDEFTYELRNGLIGHQQMVGLYGSKAIEDVFHMDAKKADSNASILFEVTAVNDMAGSVTFKATSNVLGKDGKLSTRVADVTVNRDDLTQNVLGVTLTFNLTSIVATPGDDATKKASTYFKVGDKMAYNVYAMATSEENNAKQPRATSKTLEIRGEQTQYKESWGSKDPDVPAYVTYENRALRYSVDADAVQGKEVHFKNFYINEDNGTYYTGDIVLGLSNEFASKVQSAAEGDTLASFTAAYVGETANSEVRLQDLNKFWNSEGVFMLKDSKTLTITQGDGKTASVTLYAQDTLKDVAMKLNKAIAQDLGQMSKLKIDNSENFDEAARSFVTFVDDAEESTSEAVKGTFVVRSAIAGENGKLSFAGDEGILNALSLGEIQQAQENSFTVSVWDAHNGNSVASSVKVTGNKLIGVVHKNVDVEFDPMANIEVTWNDTTKSFMMKKEVNPYETTLHLADNSTVFQIGANEGEDMGINIGDMRAEALGLSGVLVTDKDSAGRSITIIDNALDKVSTQRAKLGAYQNRLEHTVNNLTVASQNLTAAESRIRDTDMAKEMMSFTKLQIMLQAGTSMLAQANGLPQNVLSLIR